MKWLLLLSLVVVWIPAAFGEADLSSAQREKLMDVLMAGVNQKGTWVSVHAAEALITLGEPAPALAAFLPQAESAAPPFRIGVWRILARCAQTSEQRQAYVERIRKVMLDANASDRPHATEALAKIQAPMNSDVERQAVKQIADGDSNMAPFAAWRIAQADEHAGVARLIELISSADPVCRCRAADALARFEPLPQERRKQLELALTKEPTDSPARPFIIEAIGGEPLRQLASTSSDPANVAVAVSQLARTGTRDDLPLLWKVFDSDAQDVRLAAAFAILRISDAKEETHKP